MRSATATGFRPDTPVPGRGRGATGEDLTAVYCGNDEIALGFLSGMARRGLHAPRHFSIVGTDDMPAAAYFAPPLTTMRLGFRDLGVHAFHMLQSELETGEPARHHSAVPELVVRASTNHLRATSGTEHPPAASSA